MAEQGPAVLKDRSAWLIFFGAIEVIMGLLAALMVPMMVVSQHMARPGQPSGAPEFSTKILLPAIFLYGFMAVFWIVMGIGSIKAARWARAIVLIASWLWLIVGLLSLVVWVVNLPSMAQMMEQSFKDMPKDMPRQMPPGFIHVMIVVQTIVMATIFAVLPLIFVLFYGSRSVKATVERRDPKIRWTDGRPLPVLALCLFLIVGAAQMLITIPMGIGVPVFGKFLEGLPMVALVLAITVILLYLARAVYHLKMAGWWGVLALGILALASNVFTFQAGFGELYSRMGFHGKQLEMMEKFWFLGRMQWIMAFQAIILLGFLGYLRRYFKPAGNP